MHTYLEARQSTGPSAGSFGGFFAENGRSCRRKRMKLGRAHGEERETSSSRVECAEWILVKKMMGVRTSIGILNLAASTRRAGDDFEQMDK